MAEPVRPRRGVPARGAALNPRWSVAVFTSREDAATLRRTIDAVLAAAGSTPTVVDVLVDHNADVAATLAAASFDGLAAGSSLRLWLVRWQDKACTWNRYLHEIAPPAAVAFFVDGYVRPRQDALALLDRALVERPDAWAATAVPSVGRSAAALRATLESQGGLHGNLYALREDVVDRFRARGFRLPLGLYRNDSLIGAVVAFAGDPARESWDPLRRIAVVSPATWDNDAAPPGIGRLKSYLKRRLRQAQGDLENAAVRQHLAVRHRSPETLPSTVEALLATGPVEPSAHRGLLDRTLRRRAARRVAAGADWSRCETPAALLRTWSGSDDRDAS